MTSTIKFPEIPRQTISQDFQPYLAASKTLNEFDKGLNQVINFTQSEQLSTARFAVKNLSTIFSIKKNIIPSDAPAEVIKAAKEAQSVTSTFADVLSIITGVGNIASLIRNLRKKNVRKEDQIVRKLEISRSALQIISLSTTVLNIFDRFKVIDLGFITKQIGAIPVIGAAIAQAFPASVVFSLFSLMSSEITIAISAIRLKQMKIRIDRIATKIKKTWNQPLDENFAKKKIDRMVTKQKDVAEKAKALKIQMEQSHPILEAQGKNYEEKKAAFEKAQGELKTANKIVRCMRTFKERNALKSAKASYKKEIKNYKYQLTEMLTLEKSHSIRAEKGEKWEAILEKFQTGKLTESETAALDKMRAEKVAKWKSKKVTELFKIAKEVSKIALTLVSMAIAVSMIALVLIYGANIPAAAIIGIAMIGLTLAAVQLINKLYFNRIKKRTAGTVKVPDFKTLRAEV